MTADTDEGPRPSPRTSGPTRSTSSPTPGERLPAAEALRRTQLWALDPGHPAVEEPIFGPAALRPPWSRGRLPTLSCVAMWAAFVHHGR